MHEQTNAQTETITQSPHAVFMVRPHHFFPNEETAVDNAFQTSAPTDKAGEIALKAQYEFDSMVNILHKAGVSVTVFDDTPTPRKDDAVFPNNWISTHPNGTILLYPMRALKRRTERREDIVTFLRTHYQVNRLVDLSYFETQAVFLEGTGALVIDYQNALAYVSLSQRAHRAALERACESAELTPIVFHATDKSRTPIYHTNVMMSIGTHFAAVCLDSISDEVERQRVVTALMATKKRIINLSLPQIDRFAGNILELFGSKGPVIVLSHSALRALTLTQKKQLELHAALCPIQVPTIEMGGGSVRCMIAGIHLFHR
ncbi:MAG: arginine deiminase-related protein [Gammaproteobacteria bacterium]